MAPLYKGGMEGISDAEAMWSYTTITTGLPETVDGTITPMHDQDAGYRAKQLDEWQALLDEVRDYLGDRADDEARARFAADQARIDELRRMAGR